MIILVKIYRYFSTCAYMLSPYSVEIALYSNYVPYFFVSLIMPKINLYLL